MGKITDLRVVFSSPKAIGTAKKGEYNDDGETIVADIDFKFDRANPLMGPQGLQLLKQECTIQGVVDRKRMDATTYTLTRLKGDSKYTFTRK